MGYERYERTDGPTADDPRVSLRASGSIGLNHAAVEAYFRGADYARLYYDAGNGRVGIEPVDGPDADGYTLQRGEAPTHGATLSALGFLRDCGLLDGETTTYPAAWDDDAGLVAVDLDDPVADATGRPGPTELHATVDWVDDVGGATNVLLSRPADAPDRDACADLLTTTDPARTGLVVVAHDRSADEWLDAYDGVADERPGTLSVIDVDPAEDASATIERADGVTVSVVPELGDLTGIGIPLANHGTGVVDGDAETLLVCFDSVSELLRAADDDRVLDFLEVVTGTVADWATRGTAVRAHYHLDADAHRAGRVESVEELVDVTVTLDEGGDVAGIRR